MFQRCCPSDCLLNSTQWGPVPLFCAGSLSLVPFALRWLEAELPGLAGQMQQSVDSFYSLMHWTGQEAAAAAAAGALGIERAADEDLHTPYCCCMHWPQQADCEVGHAAEAPALVLLSFAGDLTALAMWRERRRRAAFALVGKHVRCVEMAWTVPGSCFHCWHFARCQMAMRDSIYERKQCGPATSRKTWLCRTAVAA